MTPEQLLLDLPDDPAMGRADFLPAPSNAAGLEAIGTWQTWPAGQMILTGPQGSGRSHLLQIWAHETHALRLSGTTLTEDAIPAAAAAPALALDDADALAGDGAGQETLFHLLNQARASGQPMLLTARETPGAWGLSLPDLESRLLACPITRLALPDDGLIQMVLVKLADDRQLALSPDVIAYLAARMNRSLRTARQLVTALDHTAVTRQKKVTRVLASEVLAALPDA